jgi:phosphate transport system permease protein
MAAPASIPVRLQARRHVVREANSGDRIFRWVTAAFGATDIVILLLIGWKLFVASRYTLRHSGLAFFVETVWDPVRGEFGGLTFLYGTLVSSALALILAVPASLGIAIFLVELAPPWLARPVGLLVELLAAVPSVIYGLWGAFVLVPLLRNYVEPSLEATMGFLPLFQGPHLGYGMLAGGIILAIMILPTISSISREVLSAVPNTLREGAQALGATPWEMVRAVVLPYARSGLVGAVMLGFGRAVGETMAVTMLIGNTPRINASLFEPGYTLASVIANEYVEAASTAHQSALTTVGLLLFLVTLALNVVARLLVWRVARPAQGEARAAA